MIPPGGDLDGKVAMITGAARGIGKAIAFSLASHGATLALCDLRCEELEQVGHTLRKRGHDVLTFDVDVSRFQQVERWVEATTKAFGIIDVLVNSAGIIESTPLIDITLESWERVLSVNLTGTFLCCQTVAKKMIQRKSGRIVNISSVAGRSGRRLAAHYAASKAGVINLSRSLALALAEHDITVNAVCPGITATPMWEQLDKEKGELFNLPAGTAFQQAVSEVPLGRAAKPDEIAEVVLFLCSSGAAYVTGQALNVCGGLERD